MSPQLLTFRAPSGSRWSAHALDVDAAISPARDAARQTWVASFSARFLELQPDEDAECVRALAEDLWADVGGHDPVISAEMEFEASVDLD